MEEGLRVALTELVAVGVRPVVTLAEFEGEDVTLEEPVTVPVTVADGVSPVVADDV